MHQSLPVGGNGATVCVLVIELVTEPMGGGTELSALFSAQEQDRLRVCLHQ